jgi:RHS repeat-associated protein
LTSIHYADDVWNRFYYDADQRRYAMEDSNGLSYFTWDTNGLNLLEERDSEGAVVAEYTHGHTPIEGIGSVTAIRQVTPDGTYYMYPAYDHRGTVAKLCKRKALDGYYNLYPYTNAWGQNPTYTENGPTPRMQYQSNWIWLTDSPNRNLFLTPTRIYHAGLGRFVQRDPIGFADGPNLYAYVQNIPIGLVDPRGEALFLTVVIAVGVAAILYGAIRVISTWIMDENARSNDKDCGMLQKAIMKRGWTPLETDFKVGSTKQRMICRYLMDCTSYGALGVVAERAGQWATVPPAGTSGSGPVAGGGSDVVVGGYTAAANELDGGCNGPKRIRANVTVLEMCAPMKPDGPPPPRPSWWHGVKRIFTWSW